MTRRSFMTSGGASQHCSQATGPVVAAQAEETSIRSFAGSAQQFHQRIGAVAISAAPLSSDRSWEAGIWKRQRKPSESGIGYPRRN
jgi:hypothetical protein